MSTKYGIKPRPELKVIDWRGGTAPAPALADEPKQQVRHSSDRITSGPQPSNEPPPYDHVPVAPNPDDDIDF